MKRKVVIRIIIIIGLILLFLYCYLSAIFSDPAYYVSPETISSTSGQSLYNPQTVLSGIANRENGIFIKSEIHLGDNPPDNYINENDFSDDELFTIGQYFLEQQWNEDSDDWKLVGLKYNLYDCEKGFDGPYLVSYTFEKKIKNNSDVYIHELHIIISSWRNQISWYEKVENRKRLSTAIKWEDVQFNAMDVYPIAEENGGKEFHLGREDQCDVSMYMINNKSGWNVSYYAEDDPGELYLDIDAKTGKVKD